MMEMKKVVLFGAGDGGLRVSYSLIGDFEVIAFVDNDSNKQGETLLGKPVLSPEKLSEIDYDFIIIANIHGDAIYEQLTMDLGVKASKIIDYYNNQIFDSRLAVLRQVADEIYYNNISGNVAELGVFQGEFAKYINKTFPDRKLFLFDTFSGFDERDIVVEKTKGFSNSQTGEFINSDIEIILKKMTVKENCIFKKGYFPESAIGIEEKFVFVSIDVDLYMPILEGLKYFYPRLEVGGYIFVHDYNSTRFFGAKQAVREFCLENGARFVPISDLCGSAVIVK
ncbi:methyltransferase [Paenibacillus sp. CFBP 13594]|nr:methyltransferase [Paenibacillus sp. CFBP 13594]QZN76541.1 methyltransferase [Paenibacillus sp. DR312]